MSKVLKLGISSENNKEIKEVVSIEVLVNKGVIGDRIGSSRRRSKSRNRSSSAMAPIAVRKVIEKFEDFKGCLTKVRGIHAKTRSA